MTKHLPAVVVSRLPANLAARIVWHETSVFGDDGQFEALGVAHVGLKSGFTLEDLEAWLAWVNQQLKPCATAGDVLRALGPMIATRRGKEGEQSDTQAALAVYGARLREYPAAVLGEVGSHFIDSTPWLPAISEILPICDRKARPMRELKRELERQIAVLKAPARPKLEAPKPLDRKTGERFEVRIANYKAAGNMKEAARVESMFAKSQKREVESWALPYLEQIVEDQKRSAEAFIREIGQ